MTARVRENWNEGAVEGKDLDVVSVRLAVIARVNGLILSPLSPKMFHG